MISGGVCYKFKILSYLKGVSVCVGGGGGSLLKVEILSVVYMYMYMCEQMDALSNKRYCTYVRAAISYMYMYKCEQMDALSTK